MPCYPICRLLLAFFNRGSLLPSHLIFLRASRIRAARCSELFFSSSTCHLSMNRSAGSRSPGTTCPPTLLHGSMSCSGESSVKLSVGRKKSRSSLRVPSQLFGGPPGAGFVRSATCANTIQLGNCPLFAVPFAPAEKSRRFRVVVSMLSHLIFLGALAYERLV